MITASTLFAGKDHIPGSEACHLCGGECDGSLSVMDYIDKTFTNRELIRVPGSKYICKGCTLSFGGGWEDLHMLDGSIKTTTEFSPRSIAPRFYSWLITSDRRTPFTKAHMVLIREIMTDNLPEPPFAIILTDTAQKQLIFRGPVGWDKNYYPVQFEDEQIDVDRIVLKQRIDMTYPIVAAIGKPALLEPVTFGMCQAYYKAYGNLVGLERWEAIQKEPISRLAAWLAPNKEEAQKYESNLGCRLEAETRGVD